MANTQRVKISSALRIATSFAPWVAAMYLFYWLDHSGTWTSETPHRAKLSVALLAAGMGLSFLVHSFYARRKQP